MLKTYGSFIYFLFSHKSVIQVIAFFKQIFRKIEKLVELWFWIFIGTGQYTASTTGIKQNLLKHFLFW